MRRLLVPVDGSECATRAACFAAELARDTGAEVSLVHVYDAPTAAAMGFVGTDDTPARLAQASFTTAKTRMGNVEIKECLVEMGHPAERILALAAARAGTQIVMGSRGRSPFKELVLGSVSERVLRHAACPVTIVH